MKRAACIFIRNNSGRVLAVARRGTKDQWGLPGGKIDNKEKPEIAAARELKEETGLEVNPSDLDLLYENMDDHGYVCITYTIDISQLKNKNSKLSGDAGPAVWITEDELLSGPFCRYNAGVLRAEKEGNTSELKLTVLGAGSAFTKKSYQTNFLISRHNHNLMIDCGSDARWSMDACGYTHRDVHAVYISHAHADHCGSVEWVAFCNYFDPGCNFKPKFFAEQQLVKSLWNNSLSGGLESLEQIDARLDTYFDVCPVKRNSYFMWEGVKFDLVQSLHIASKYCIVDSFGLMFTSPCSGKRIYITSDVQFAPETSMRAFYREADQRHSKHVARLNEKITNCRKDFQHKLSKKLVEEYDIFYMEHLDIVSMLESDSKKKNLHKHIEDCSWSRFRDMISYKAGNASKKVILVDPKNTSQMCSGCGAIIPKELSQRMHICDHCGLKMDRDHNAAINIFNRGKAELFPGRVGTNSLIPSRSSLL